MSLSEGLYGRTESTALYHEVQQFYGRQMRAMDEGRATEWANTFTVDGVFDANGHPRPHEGRAAIEKGARDAAKKLADEGVQRRHWLGMLEVDERPDGTIVAKTYALIISTPLGGQSAVHISCSCEDVLVRDEGVLLVRHRRVHRDDLPKD